MLLATSILLGVLGYVARFEAAREVAGFKMHALGVSLMVFAFLGVMAWAMRATPLRRFRPAGPTPQPA